MLGKAYILHLEGSESLLSTKQGTYVITAGRVQVSKNTAWTKRQPSQHANDCHACAYLTVRLLAARAGTTTTELFGLAAAGIGDQESTVVRHEELLELQSRGSVVVLGVVGDEGLGDGLADGVNLRSVTTTRDTDADVDSPAALAVNEEHVRELVLADNQDGLVRLPAQGLRLDERDGLAVQADLALALLGVSDCRRSLLLAETRDERRRTLRFRHLLCVSSVHTRSARTYLDVWYGRNLAACVRFSNRAPRPRLYT